MNNTLDHIPDFLLRSSQQLPRPGRQVGALTHEGEGGDLHPAAACPGDPGHHQVRLLGLLPDQDLGPLLDEVDLEGPAGELHPNGLGGSVPVVDMR